MKKAVILIASAIVMAMPSCARKGTVNTPDGTQQTIQADSAKKKATVKALPLTVTSKILETIQDEYKGSVVFIDLWATWCGPCRMAMVSVDSIKPELVKQGAKFVYITGETSPKATWEKMYPDIEGDHYRLTKEQWNTLCTEQGVRGIPCYKLVNKDGSTAFSNLTEGGYPGNAVIKPEIEKALKAEAKK